MYGKFFTSTFTGSMLGVGPTIFAVWAYTIAHAVSETVELNPKMLAVAIGCSPEDVKAAIEYLCLPDPESRNPAEGGRRLIKLGQYAYHVVNHDLYNHMRDEEDR